MYLQQQPSATSNNNNDNENTNNNNNNNTTTTAAIRALDLPEIRLVISTFLPRRHCVPCLLVSKSFYTTFLPQIWRSPNLYPYPLTPKNSHFSAALVGKHGHLLQEIGPLFSARQFSFLAGARLEGLRSVTVHQLRTLQDREAFEKVLLSQRQLDVVLRLEEFRSHGYAVDAETLVGLGILPSLSTPFSEDGMSIARQLPFTNSLRCLTLENMDMDHSTFSDVLRYSAHLTDLALAKVVFTSPLSPSSETPLFTSTRICTLTATIHQTLHLGHQDSAPPPLLVHLPALTTWKISLIDFQDTDIRPTLAQSLHQAVNTHTPLLTNLEFRWGTTALINSLLTGAFSDIKIKRIGFTYSKDKCSLDGMMPGVLRHAHSLVALSLSGFNLMRIIRNPTPPPSPQLDPLDTMFSKLVRSCPHLRVLSIPHYTAKIESFEQDEEWACQDLETLCVKVQGLDDVDACLTKIMALRNSTTWRSSGQVEIEGEGIGDRVIKRLIGLRRLKTVWLGTKDVYLATIR